MRQVGDGTPVGAADPEADPAPESGRGADLGWLRGGWRDLFAAPTTPIGREWAAHGSAPRSEDTGTMTPAPPVAPGPEELRKRRISGRHRWYAGALVGLSFLVVAMVQAATSGGSVTSIVVFEVLSVVFGACYMLLPMRVAGGFTEVPAGSWTKLGALAVMVAITIPMIIVGGTGVTGLWIYIGVAAAMMFPLAWALAIAAVLAAAMLVIAAVPGDSLPWELALTLVALTLWMAGFAGNIRLTIELRDTREELARSAVAAERARIGRDLHDILGHSLTAIAVKAGLARRLLGRSDGGGAEAAGTEIADVERLAREALADVRATAAGYRDVSLAGELAVARSALTSAGIRAEVPTAVDDVSPAGREVFGYVVREAVTNVVRHSGAGRCVISLTRTSVQITDDGRGQPAPALDGQASAPDRPACDPLAVPGSGLRGLAERVSAAGGTLEAGPLDGGGFRVSATMPVTAPAGGAGASGRPPAVPDPATPVTDRVGRSGPEPAETSVTGWFDPSVTESTDASVTDRADPSVTDRPAPSISRPAR